MTTSTDPVRALIGEMTEYLDQQVDPELDVIAKWRDRLKSALASAPPSAPVGVEGSSANGGWTITPPSAPVEVEGFDKRFAEMLLGILSDVQDELGFTDEDKLCANGSAEIVAEIRELKRVAALAQPPAAPSGEAVGDWVLVPRVPTDAMLRAAQSAWLNDTLRRTTTLWRAMLAAAPQQPVGVDAPEIDLEAIAWAYRKLLAFGCYSSEQGAMMGDRLNLMLLAAQQQGGA